jgi:hypothetical protein
MASFNKVFLIVFLLIAAGTVPAPAQAVGNIHFSKLEIHPYLSLEDIFSDNVYSTHTDQKRDQVAVITPGIQLQFPFGNQLFEADYHAVLRRYDTYKGDDTDDRHARGSLDLEFGRRFDLRLTGKFDKDHEPRSSSATGFIEVYRTNEGAAAATYQLAGRSKVQIEYRQVSYNFMTSNFRDRDETVLSGLVYYRFLPKTSAFIEYDHKNVDFVPDTTQLDNTMDYTLIGVTWEATAKSRGTIRAGKVTKDFVEASGSDFNLWVFFVDLNHQFAQHTSLLLKAKRDVNETNLLGTSYFITTGLSGELRQEFGYRLAGLARMSYGKDDFSNAVLPETAVRSDKTIVEGAGLRYSVREWFILGADYNYQSRNSNIDINDYREHQYVLSASMTF